jgi:hypothetical protein
MTFSVMNDRRAATWEAIDPTGSIVGWLLENGEKSGLFCDQVVAPSHLGYVPSNALLISPPAM